VRIDLKNLNPDGENFVLTRQSGELNEAIKDLLGSNQYKIQFQLRPLSSSGSFEMVGTIDTMLPEQCSRCGDDFNFEIHESFRELLLPSMPQERLDKYAKINHFSDMTQDDLEVTEYSEDQFFNAAEYLHEKIALSIPYNPAPALEDDGKCRLCGAMFDASGLIYNEVLPESPSPFAGLKGLKIN
jgi:uncharacterized protein